VGLGEAQRAAAERAIRACGRWFDVRPGLDVRQPVDLAPSWADFLCRGATRYSATCLRPMTVSVRLDQAEVSTRQARFRIRDPSLDWRASCAENDGLGM